MNLCITQARLTSSRLFQKVLMPIGNDTVLGLHLKRLKKASKIDQLIVAIADEKGSENICAICDENNVEYSIGSVNDVLARFYFAAKDKRADTIIRVTSDCPLIDPHCLDDLISRYEELQVDYFSNCNPPTFPDGLDAELFSFQALENAFLEATDTFDREHVTPFIRRQANSKGLMGNFLGNQDYSMYRLTIDNKEDLELVQNLVGEVGALAPFTEYIDYLNQHPDIMKINSKFTRNEGSKQRKLENE